MNMMRNFGRFAKCSREDIAMKGYYLEDAYWGYIPDEDRYYPFDTEDEYVQYYRECIMIAA